MKKWFLFLSIIFVSVSFFSQIKSVSASGELKMINVNVLDLLVIKDVDKIIIAKENFAQGQSIYKEITDKDQIKEILDSIKEMREQPVVDTLPQYRLSFYKSQTKIADLGFFIDGEWTFFRLNSTKGQRDFKADKEFIKIFQNWLPEKGR